MIATANIGCLTHHGKPCPDVPVRHWIELLDATDPSKGTSWNMTMNLPLLIEPDRLSEEYIRLLTDILIVDINKAETYL